MDEQKWLEISLILDGELTEAVAEVIARFIPTGIVIESTAIDTSSPEDEGRPVGPMRVSGYLPVDSQLENTRQRLEEALWYLGRIQPIPAPQFKLVQDDDWSAAWKKNYHPIDIGNRLQIIPAWIELTVSDRIPIRIDPGMAFGTGTHPTTQLCLEAIDDLMYQYNHVGLEENPVYIIDVGCGSGILSIAALKLGARRAIGVDIDADSVHASMENAILNGVSDLFEIGLGSVDDILAGIFSFQKAQLVLANILAPVIVRLLDSNISRLLSDSGKLVLSGILEEQAQEVQSALERNELYLVERRQINDWVVLIASK